MFPDTSVRMSSRMPCESPYRTTTSRNGCFRNHGVSVVFTVTRTCVFSAR